MRNWEHSRQKGVKNTNFAICLRERTNECELRRETQLRNNLYYFRNNKFEEHAVEMVIDGVGR